MNFISIEGIVEEIIFFNEVNGYIICDMISDKMSFTAVGYMPFISVGETLKLTGKWVTHSEYGEQLKVETYEKLLPTTLNAIEKYLGSGIIKGIGPSTAKKIIKKFGEDTLNIIQFKPNELTKVKGISKDKAFLISEIFNEQRELRSVVLFFQDYGISPMFAAKIYKTFGENTIEQVKENPYRLTSEFIGISFKTADQIAKSLGVDLYAKTRICSGIKYVLSQGGINGHTFIPEKILMEKTTALLDINISSIEDYLISLMLDKSIHVDKNDDFNRVYLRAYYEAELGVSYRLVELSRANLNKALINYDKRINEIELEQSVSLADMQKTAIKEAITNGVLVITGGPGTGKTTIIKSIIRFLSKDGCTVVLAAPTGRAAKRMSDTTGFDAKTIHRLLEIGFSGNDIEPEFSKNEFNPIEANVVIIDEMSMMDILLMNQLLRAITLGTRVILVGDIDQLPSVGAGNVLKDIISSGVIKTVKLTEIFRQAQESMIIVNAHRINNGEMPHINMKEKDFFFIERKSPEDIVKTVVELSSNRLPTAYGYDPMKHIQILSPTKKGITGIVNLNKELQKKLNSENKSKKERIYKDFVLREGDRVMQIKNNYDLRWKKLDESEEGVGVFNGDTGQIVEISMQEKKVRVLFDDDKITEYDFNNLEELEHAFSITIHKSQGSEFRVVILPLFRGPDILMTRNLLYTAITRAKELVVLVGQKDVILQMINNKKEASRYSNLEKRLKGYLLSTAIQVSIEGSAT